MCSVVLKKGDMVKLINCDEANNHEAEVWVVDFMTQVLDHYRIENVKTGFRDTFSKSYLQKLNVYRVRGIKYINYTNKMSNSKAGDIVCFYESGSKCNIGYGIIDFVIPMKVINSEKKESIRELFLGDDHSAYISYALNTMNITFPWVPYAEEVYNVMLHKEARYYDHCIKNGCWYKEPHNVGNYAVGIKNIVKY